jgi:hypothetical protein
VTNDEILQLIIRAVGHPKRLSDFDTISAGSVRFTYEGTRYRVTDSLHVEEVAHGCLCGTDAARRMEARLNATRT